MKRISSLFLALALLLSVALGGCAGSETGGSQSAAGKTTAQKTSQYFETPEAAAEYFINCIREGSVEGALAAFPIDERVENADFVATAKSISSVMVLKSTTLPPVELYPYYDALARENAREDYMSSIRLFIYALTDMDTGIEYGSYYFQPITEAGLADLGLDSWEDLARQYDPAKAQALTVLEMFNIRDMTEYMEVSEEQYQQYLEFEKNRSLRQFGMDDMEREAYIVLCQADEQAYYCTMEFLKFPKGWKLQSLYCSLQSVTNNSSPIVPISEDMLSMFRQVSALIQ